MERASAVEARDNRAHRFACLRASRKRKRSFRYLPSEAFWSPEWRRDGLGCLLLMFFALSQFQARKQAALHTKAPKEVKSIPKTREKNVSIQTPTKRKDLLG